MAEVTVIVPTYFGGNMLFHCINSLLEQCPNVKVLINKNDVGFLKACNDTIRMLATDIILLNDDTKVTTNIVEEMRNLAYSDPRIGIVGGKSLSPSDPNTIINYGVHVAIDGNTGHKYFGQSKDSVDIENQKAVEGSLMYIKREVIDAIGVFDEDYGLGYREEIDYCFRAREAGWKIVSCPTAEYIHYTSQTNSKLGIHNDTYAIFMGKWGTKLKLGTV